MKILNPHETYDCCKRCITPFCKDSTCVLWDAEFTRRWKEMQELFKAIPPDKPLDPEKERERYIAEKQRAAKAEYSREYRAKNREQELARQRAYRARLKAEKEGRNNVDTARSSSDTRT